MQYSLPSLTRCNIQCATQPAGAFESSRDACDGNQSNMLASLVQQHTHTHTQSAEVQPVQHTADTNPGWAMHGHRVVCSHLVPHKHATCTPLGAPPMQPHHLRSACFCCCCCLKASQAAVLENIPSLSHIARREWQGGEHNITYNTMGHTTPHTTWRHTMLCGRSR